MLNNKDTILEKIGYLKTKVPEKVFSTENQVKEYNKIQPFFYNKSKIWWLWNSKRFCWEQTDEIDILNTIETNANINSPKDRATIINALKQEGRKNIPIPMEKDWVQFHDTIYNIKTGESFVAHEGYFVTNPIPYKIGEKLETPTLDKIFEEWVGVACIPTLYEIIAYSLLPDYPLNRIFCFIGAGSNGKSCFLNLLTKFVGKENCCSTELDTLLSSRFEMAKLHRKLVCQMGETNFNEMKKTSTLKKLTGQDLVSFELKHKTPFDETNYAKIILSTNNLPTTSDKTDGFYRRWMIIDFPNKFSEKNDILATIPEEEYNNLAKKSLTVLKDLLKKREFTGEGTIEERTKRFEEKSNPLQKFWDEELEENYDGFIFKWELRERLRDWTKQKKFRQISERETFRFMSEKGVTDARKQSMNMDDSGNLKAYPAWKGISWK